MLLIMLLEYGDEGIRCDDAGDETSRQELILIASMYLQSDGTSTTHEIITYKQQTYMSETVLSLLVYYMLCQCGSTMNMHGER